MKEIPLQGGNSNDEVVRVANTVRRKVSAYSPTVHRLLNHINKAEFTAAPTFLGIDEKGREILTYINGECTVQPSHWIEDAYLVSAAHLLKQYHDATEDFPANEDNTWAYRYPDATKHEVICHNDFAPYNLVAEGGKFVGVIDFDLCGPGPRIRDVAYAAYWLVPLSIRNSDTKAAASNDASNGSERLKQFCSAYGVQANSALLDMVEEVLTHMSNEQVVIDMIGVEAAQRLKAEGHLEHWAQEQIAFVEFRSQIELNL